MKTFLFMVEEGLIYWLGDLSGLMAQGQEAGLASKKTADRLEAAVGRRLGDNG